MTDSKPTLEYRRPSSQPIHRVERARGTLFYIPPRYVWHDSVFWLCFGLATTLSSLVFLEPLLESFRYQERGLFALVLLLVGAWGFCGWLSAKASTAMHPHWRLLVSGSQVSFHTRARWKTVEGAWPRDQISEIVLDDGTCDACETPPYTSVGVRLRNGQYLGLVMVDAAHSEDLASMAQAMSRLLDLPLSFSSARSNASAGGTTKPARTPSGSLQTQIGDAVHALGLELMRAA